MDVEKARIAFAARAGQHCSRMRLVEPLVGREADVAIDEEDAAVGIADERYPDRFEPTAERRDQSAKRRQYLGVVDRFARLKPQRIVVPGQPPQEAERGRPKAGEWCR